MKLIAEINENVKLLTEKAKDGGKNYYIEGVFLQGDLKNRNGRVYPINMLKEKVQQYVETYVKSRRAFGELGHPEGPSINLDRVSHIIESLKPSGNDFIGRAKITKSTPMGSIAASLIDEGAKLGVSSRGMGTLVNEGGNQVVQDDYMIATAADIVADPSAPDAFVEGIMEGRNWVYDPFSKTWYADQAVEKAKKTIRESVNKSDLENRLLRAFANYMVDVTKQPK